jgi:hypothetical protein
VDRLLAAELHWSRSRIQRMERAGELVVLPAGSRLRRAVRDGTRLVIDLSQASDSKVVMAAGSVRGGPAGSA